MFRRSAQVPVLAALSTLASVFAGDVRRGVDPEPAAAQCVGDCNGTQMVELVDLVIGLNIMLGSYPVAYCPTWDPNGDGRVTIDELLTGVHQSLNGCPVAAQPTPTCGDGAISGAEQCDDGNTVGGDGCSVDCTIEGPGAVDQIWIGCGATGGNININYAEPIGQEFTPGRPALTGVAVRVDTQVAVDPADAPLTARIRQGSIDGPVLGEATTAVPRGGAQLFVLDPPVRVVPGVRYVLQLTTQNPGLSWVRASPVGACAYSAGRPIFFGVPLESAGDPEDLVFQTFASP